MKIDHTCPDARYWSEVLCCTIPTHMSDLQVKVMDFEILEAKHDLGELHCPATALILGIRN